MMNFNLQYFLLIASIYAIYVPQGNLSGNTSASLDTGATIYSTFAAPPPQFSYTISTSCTSSITQTFAAPVVTTPCTLSLITKAPLYTSTPEYTTTAGPEVSVYSTIAYYSTSQETLRESIYESRGASVNAPPYYVPTSAAPEASTYPVSAYYAAPEVTTYGAPEVTSYTVPTYKAPQPYIQEEYAPQVTTVVASQAYVAPAYEAPQPPTYVAPTYEAPTYVAPTYEAPTYEALTYKAPTYEAPTNKVPTYEAPTYEAPTYEAPKVSYAAPKSYNQEEYAPQAETYKNYRPSVPTEAAPIATPDCTEAAPVATQTPSGYLSNPETFEVQSNGLYGGSSTTASPSTETSSPEYLPPASAEYSIESFAFATSGTNGLGFIFITLLLLIN